MLGQLLKQPSLNDLVDDAANTLAAKVIRLHAVTNGFTVPFADLDPVRQISAVTACTTYVHCSNLINAAGFGHVKSALQRLNPAATKYVQDTLKVINEQAQTPEITAQVDASIKLHVPEDDDCDLCKKPADDEPNVKPLPHIVRDTKTA